MIKTRVVLTSILKKYTFCDEAEPFYKMNCTCAWKWFTFISLSILWSVLKAINRLSFTVHWQLQCFPWINTYTLTEVSSHSTHYVGILRPVKQFTWWGEGYSEGSATVSQEGGIELNLHNTRRKDKFKLSFFLW
jgi:hypothetical protein